MALLALLALAGCCHSGKRADNAFPYRLARNAERVAPGAAGPTLSLDYSEQSRGNPIGDFMYFVPLISPDPVSVQDSGHAQRARFVSLSRRFSSTAFSAECEFSFTGNESHRNILENTED